MENFLPDTRELKERTVLFMTRFLVKEISALSDPKDLVPSESPLHPVQKTEVIPMCVLFKDEKYTSETVDILAQLMIDANLNGQPQVHVYDMYTCTCNVWDLVGHCLLTKVFIGKLPATRELWVIIG